MTIDDKIRDEKLQHNINREAAKILTLSSGKIEQYEYLTGNEMLPFGQSRMIEQTKLTYPPLEKAFVKQIKTIDDQGRKQVESLKVLKPVNINKNKSKLNKFFQKIQKTMKLRMI